MDIDQHTEELLQAGYRYALSLTHDENAAEDLVQETWLKLFRCGKLADCKKGLFSVTLRNLFIDQYRRKQRVVFEALDPEFHSPEYSCELDDEIDGEDLKQALALIKSEEREAIYLNVVEGYTTQEIAELTGRPRGTILSLIHRGKKKLMRHLTRGTPDAEDLGNQRRISP
ncbi:MAG: RNA polymerase sigma factor [Planctomycetes bacterium]|nr:RNA polymerase sigma factor [Planctomycetota bacterium]